MNTTPDLEYLARQALLTEGVAAYFPGLDPASFDSVATLAQHLADDPQSWSPAGPDYSWTLDTSPALLAAYAEACGAQRLAHVLLDDLNDLPDSADVNDALALAENHGWLAPSTDLDDPEAFRLIDGTVIHWTRNGWRIDSDRSA